MRSWITLLVLALAVGGLGAWLHYKPRADEPVTYTLSTIKPAEVTRVKLLRQSAAAGFPSEEIVLEKRDGQWRMSAPYAARADAFQVERLLGILDARTSVRYPAADLARYGLDAPPAVLTANDQTIAYGAINATTREQYVLTRDHVYVVPATFAAAVPRNAQALLSKALFAPGETAVRFDLPDFTVALEEGTWAIAPIASDAGPDERNAWVDAWHKASALTVSRHAGEAPADDIRIVLKDGRTIALGIAQRAPDVVLVRKDEGLAYHFFAEAGRRLLAPPAGGERANK